MTRLPEIAYPPRKPYPSDLSDAEWEILKPLVPKPKGFGHPVEVDFREIFNGIFYVQRTGCQWEMMPHDLPPYSTVYNYFQKWQRKGIWQLLHDKVRQQLRTELGRNEQSTVAIADSQSVKTTEKRGRSMVLTVARRLKGVSVILS
jgi:putative transposase